MAPPREVCGLSPSVDLRRSSEMRRVSGLASAVGLALCVITGVAHATVARRTTLPDMAARATHVVHAVVLSQAAAWERGHIYTTTELGILEAIKAPAGAGKT